MFYIADVSFTRYTSALFECVRVWLPAVGFFYAVALGNAAPRPKAVAMFECVYVCGRVGEEWLCRRLNSIRLTLKRIFFW